MTAWGTSWGVFRHWWVVLKLVLTVLATAVLLVETRVIRALAEAAATGGDLRDLPGSLPHSVGGLAVLLVVTILSIHEPRGLTRYGWRRPRDRSSVTA